MSTLPSDKILSIDDPIPPGQEWAVVKMVDEMAGMTWYLVRDEAEARKWSRVKGHPATPEGRACFTADEMWWLFPWLAEMPMDERLTFFQELIGFKLIFGWGGPVMVFKKGEAHKRESYTWAQDEPAAPPRAHESKSVAPFPPVWKFWCDACKGPCRNPELAQVQIEGHGVCTVPPNFRETEKIKAYERYEDALDGCRAGIAWVEEPGEGPGGDAGSPVVDGSSLDGKAGDVREGAGRPEGGSRAPDRGRQGGGEGHAGGGQAIRKGRGQRNAQPKDHGRGRRRP